MTKKHFIELAKTVGRLTISEKAKKEVANRLADFCSNQNPNFNRETFLYACFSK